MALHPKLIAGWKKHNKERREATHCGRGHEYNEQNTYWYKRGKRLRRQCRVCRKDQAIERQRRYLAEMRADPNDERHGTQKGYKYGCRCLRCRVANHQAARQWRIDHGLNVLPDYGVADEPPKGVAA